MLGAAEYFVAHCAARGPEWPTSVGPWQKFRRSLATLRKRDGPADAALAGDAWVGFRAEVGSPAGWRYGKIRGGRSKRNRPIRNGISWAVALAGGRSGPLANLMPCRLGVGKRHRHERCGTACEASGVSVCSRGLARWRYRRPLVEARIQSTARRACVPGRLHRIQKYIWSRVPITSASSTPGRPARMHWRSGVISSHAVSAKS